MSYVQIFGYNFLFGIVGFVGMTVGRHCGMWEVIVGNCGIVGCGKILWGHFVGNLWDGCGALVGWLWDKASCSNVLQT